MSRVIYKYQFVERDLVLRLPFSARVVLAANDPASDALSIWVEHDPAENAASRTFRVYGTGAEIDGDGGHPSPIHCGSFVDTPFVWHVYEVRA